MEASRTTVRVAGSSNNKNNLAEPKGRHAAQGADKLESSTYPAKTAQKLQSNSRTRRRSKSHSRSRSRSRPILSWQQKAAKRASVCCRAWFIWLYRCLVALTVLAAMLQYTGELPVDRGQTYRGLSSTEIAASQGAFAELSYGSTYYILHEPEKIGLNGNVTSRRPLFLCIHGAGTASYVWGPLADRLGASGERVLTFDMWAHGYSDAPDTRYNTALIVSQIVELLAVLDLDRAPVILIGAQFGASVAQLYARRRPKNVHALVLLGEEDAPSDCRASNEMADAQLFGDTLPLSVAAVKYLPGQLGHRFLGLILPRELHNWLAQCHKRPALRQVTVPVAGNRDSYVKWIALAAARWREPGFIRATYSLLRSKMDADTTLVDNGLDCDNQQLLAPTLRFVTRVGRLPIPARETRHRVLGVGHDGGDCGEAALREESEEVHHVTQNWLSTLSSARGENTGVNTHISSDTSDYYNGSLISIAQAEEEYGSAVVQLAIENQQLAHGVGGWSFALAAALGSFYQKQNLLLNQLSEDIASAQQGLDSCQYDLSHLNSTLSIAREWQTRNNLARSQPLGTQEDHLRSVQEGYRACAADRVSAMQVCCAASIITTLNLILLTQLLVLSGNRPANQPRHHQVEWSY